MIYKTITLNQIYKKSATLTIDIRYALCKLQCVSEIIFQKCSERFFKSLQKQGK